MEQKPTVTCLLQKIDSIHQLDRAIRLACIPGSLQFAGPATIRRIIRNFVHVRATVAEKTTNSAVSGTGRNLPASGAKAPVNLPRCSTRTGLKISESGHVASLGSRNDESFMHRPAGRTATGTFYHFAATPVLEMRTGSRKQCLPLSTSISLTIVREKFASFLPSFPSRPLDTGAKVRDQSAGSSSHLALVYYLRF